MKNIREAATRAAAISLVSFALVLSLVACERKAQPANELVVGIDVEPERFDPLTMKNPKNFIVSWQIYEGLFTLDTTGRIAPALAEKWETKDNVTWRIRLRQGVLFHSSELFGSPAKSRPMSADDVVASYTAFCSAGAYPAFLLTDSVRGCADYNAGKAKSVEGVRAVDASTIEIELVKPEPFFLSRLTTAWIAIFPKEQLDPRHDAARGLSLAVGTGPFRLVSRTNSEITLERNPDYWNKASSGSLAKLVYRVITTDEARLAELRKGGIDVMLVPLAAFQSVLEPSGALKADYADKVRVQAFATINSHMIGINDALVADVHLRRAMNYGVDRRQIVEKLVYRQADTTVGTVPPGTNGYKPPFDANSIFDVRKAREELAKSSYKGEPLEMLVHEQAASEQIGQLFQSQMKSIGVNIKLTKVDFNSAIGRMVKGDAQLFSMYFDYVFSSPEAILVNIFASSKRPVPNFWQFSDTSIDSQLESLRGIPPADSLVKSGEIERQIMEQAPALFLFRLKLLVLQSNRFADLQVNPHGHFLFDRVTPAAK